MKIARTITTLGASAALLFAAAPPAAAEEISCRGTIGGRTVDNVKVPAGATCTLDGTVVQGTINVNSGATLYALGVRVVGNVQGENARRVEIRAGSQVGGSVQVVQGNSALIKRNRIHGDILFDDQTGRVAARHNKVGDNIQAFQNTGGVVIADNTVDGNLQCKENDPRPTGGNNTVHGNKEDQCRRL
jgi:hypothetical protein